MSVFLDMDPSAVPVDSLLTESLYEPFYKNDSGIVVTMRDPTTIRTHPRPLLGTEVSTFPVPVQSKFLSNQKN